MPFYNFLVKLLACGQAQPILQQLLFFIFFQKFFLLFLLFTLSAHLLPPLLFAIAFDISIADGVL